MNENDLRTSDVEERRGGEEDDGKEI